MSDSHSSPSGTLLICNTTSQRIFNEHEALALEAITTQAQPLSVTHPAYNTPAMQPAPPPRHAPEPPRHETPGWGMPSPEMPAQYGHEVDGWGRPIDPAHQGVPAPEQSDDYPTPVFVPAQPSSRRGGDLAHISRFDSSYAPPRTPYDDQGASYSSSDPRRIFELSSSRARFSPLSSSKGKGKKRAFDERGDADTDADTSERMLSPIKRARLSDPVRAQAAVYEEIGHWNRSLARSASAVEIETYGHPTPTTYRMVSPASDSHDPGYNPLSPAPAESGSQFAYDPAPASPPAYNPVSPVYSPSSPIPSHHTLSPNPRDVSPGPRYTPTSPVFDPRSPTVGHAELDQYQPGAPVPPPWSPAGLDTKDDKENKLEAGPVLNLVGPSPPRRGLRERRAAKPRGSYGMWGA